MHKKIGNIYIQSQKDRKNIKERELQLKRAYKERCECRQVRERRGERQHEKEAASRFEQQGKPK
jgi:hypothetical protein